MKESSEIKGLVKKIYDSSQSWLTFVNTTGNECAMTDRVIERIINTTKELEKVYKEQFEEMK